MLNLFFQAALVNRIIRVTYANIPSTSKTNAINVTVLKMSELWKITSKPNYSMNSEIISPECGIDSSVNWLLSFVKDLADTQNHVVDRLDPDMSQDCIKVVFHENRFSNFLVGRDDKIIPITFEAWPSLSCDASCPMCTYSINRARPRKNSNLKLDLAEETVMSNLMFELASVGVHSVIWTGGGEPTLHPQLVKLAKSTYTANLKWGMFTHGIHLSEKIVDGLLESKPVFLRLSINAGSPQSHDKEYGLGDEIYNLVQENAVMACLKASGSSTKIGLGYALSGNTTTDELSGMAQFISNIMEKSGGNLAFAAFRPKVSFYQSNGKPANKQPFAKQLGNLPNLIEDYIAKPLREKFASNLSIQIKYGMFKRLAEGCSPSSSLATPWAGSISHTGHGYIISELNGSPWTNSCYGNFSINTFDQVWNSEERHRLRKSYEIGEFLAPGHHKLVHVDEMLKKIRKKIGFLTPEQVKAFYLHFHKLNIVRPSHWDFL